MNSEFTYSRDGERYEGEKYETRELCAEAAIEELGLDPGDGFCIGEVIQPTGEEWIPDGDRIIEIMRDDHSDSDSAGEWSESWLEKVKPEDEKSLTEAVRAAVAKWMDDTGNRPEFFTVENVTEHIAPYAAQGPADGEKA